MQEIEWNDKKALLIDFKDLDRDGESRLRIFLMEPNDIEVLVFKVSDIMFIPKDMRDMLTYSKMVHVAILPKNFKVIPTNYEICLACGGTGRISYMSNDIYRLETCSKCGGTGKVPPSEKEDEKND